jgi:hypothetical protein
MVADRYGDAIAVAALVDACWLLCVAWSSYALKQLLAFLWCFCWYPAD